MSNRKVDAKFTTTSYRQIGFCIYCGSRQPPLTREHVIPRGLGGKISPVAAHTAAVLGKASCETCRKITHQFETWCLQRMFGHLRIRLGMSQSEAPKRVKGRLRFADGSTKDVTGHPDDFPASLMLPIFDKTPRLWLPDGTHVPAHQFIHKLIFEPRKPSPFEAPEVGMNLQFDIEPYQRMIAKIALGAAILKYGTDYFTPLVCDFIRGVEQDAVGKYIFGYDLKDERAPFMGETHSMIQREHKHCGVNYVIVFVRLFAIYGAPTNGVIVGSVK